MKNAVQKLERKAADFERAGDRLATYTKSACDRRSQDVRMWAAGGFGLVLGLFLILILPRFLPYSADSHVAGLVMGRDRVSAGMAMIETADPRKAHNIEWSSQFYENNAGGIGSCFVATAETGKNRTCTITVGWGRP